jgi:anti-sigma factor RsiW
MPGHLTDEDIGRYRNRVMPPAESLAANAHLATCEDCYRRFDRDYISEAFRLARAHLASAETATGDHINYDERVGFVDGTLGAQDRAIIESHLEICSRCETDVEDLRLVKSTLGTEIELSPRRPLPTPGMIAALRQQPGLRSGILMAGAAIVAGIAVWVAMQPLASEVDRSRRLIQEQQVAIETMKSEAEELRRQNAEIDDELTRTQGELDALLAGGSNPNLSMETQSFSLNDGNRVVSMDSSGRLSGLAQLSRTDELLVKSVLISRRVKTPPTIAQLTGRSGSVMGASAASDRYPLLNPVRTVVATDRPTLRWRAFEGASNYVVGVYDSNMNEVATSQPLSETEWTMPRPLKRGKIYTWQVRATKGGAEIRLPASDMPDAKFKILEQSRAQTLDGTRRTYGDSHLVMGILYADAGLLDDAQRELEALVRANSQSIVAGRLLASLKAVYSK